MTRTRTATTAASRARTSRTSSLRALPEVLIVDDDSGIRGALCRGLELEGFAVRDVAEGEAALREIVARPPAVVVLDVAMPGISGVEVVRRLRQDGLTLPVCMLSARNEIDDRVAGLAAGADDYVVKPFSIAELAARLHALVRLHHQRPTRPLIVGELTIDPGRRIVTRAARDLELTTREFDLVLALATHAGQVMTRRQLLEQVWGYTWDVDSNAVDVFVGYVRKKMSEPRIVHTVRGVGFVLRP